MHRKPESEQTEEDISDKVLTWNKSEKQSNHMTTEKTKKPLTHLKSEAVDTVRLLMDKSGLSRNDHSTGDDFSSAALSSPSNSMYVLDTTTNTNTSNSNNNNNQLFLDCLDRSSWIYHLIHFALVLFHALLFDSALFCMWLRVALR